MIYYYGGSFDPVTLAHIELFKAIAKQLRKNDTLLIGVANNDEKNYKAPIGDRMDMVNKLVETKLKNTNVRVIRQDTRTYKFLQDYQQQCGKTDFTICVGEDEWKSLCDGKWVNWDLLLKQYEFIVFNRYDSEEIVLPKHINPNVSFQSAGDTSGISSSATREILFRDPDCHYEQVKNLVTHPTFRYIKEHELYFQNGPDYEKKEKQFLAEYAIKKAQNGWGEPSVTADVVAYNGDEILLIRRGNFPYKNYWCTVGGFFDLTDEDLNHTASREFMEETTLKYDPINFHQIKTYSHQFDPRMRIIDTAFEVRIAKKDMKNAVGSDDAAEARWFNINDLPNLGFHHNQIIEDWKKKHNKEDYL